MRWLYVRCTRCTVKCVVSSEIDKKNKQLYQQRIWKMWASEYLVPTTHIHTHTSIRKNKIVDLCLLTRCIDANFSPQTLRVIAYGRIGGEWLVCDIVIAICVCHCLHQQMACMQAGHIEMAISFIKQYHMMPFVAAIRSTPDTMKPIRKRT